MVDIFTYLISIFGSREEKAMKKQYFSFQLKRFFTNPKNIGLFALTFIFSLYFGLVSVPNRQLIEKVDPYAITESIVDIHYS